MIGVVILFALICLALIAFCAYREWGAARERRELYQRLQAPDLATTQHAREQALRAPARVIPIDDDAAWAEMRRRREELSHDRS